MLSQLEIINNVSGGWGNAHQIWRVPGEKNTRGGPKLALLPCSLILAYQGLEEENLDKKNHLVLQIWC